MFNKDYTIKGKHAEYMRFLVSSSEGLTLGRSAKIFDYGYQLLTIAPMIGALYDLKPEVEENKGMDFTVKAIQMIRNKEKLEKTYRLILLGERTLKISPDDRINFVFRPQNDDKEKADELFNSYMRGGIEWLYNKTCKNGTNSDNYLSNIISAIHEFTQEFCIYNNIEEKVREIEEAYF